MDLDMYRLLKLPWGLSRYATFHRRSGIMLMTGID
jgi:hypothetical protein